jgi:hypothetical protein
MKEDLGREVQAFLSGTYPFRIRVEKGELGRKRLRVVNVGAGIGGDDLESIAHLIMRLSRCDTRTLEGDAEFSQTRSRIVRLALSAGLRIPYLLRRICSFCVSTELVQGDVIFVLPLIREFLARQSASARQAAALPLMSEHAFAQATPVPSSSA